MWRGARRACPGGYGPAARRGHGTACGGNLGRTCRLGRWRRSSSGMSTQQVPDGPKIYHILHVDRLLSILADGYLWCDATVRQLGTPGTAIGLNHIKKRRLIKGLNSHPGLHVGDCVPFYFCPRSVMLYVIYRADLRELAYRDGQEAIVHLEADLRRSVRWANENGRRWAFTLSNAGSHFFDDYSDLGFLHKVDWAAVEARDWSRCKESKQAEFLIEGSFPWELVDRVGVFSRLKYNDALSTVRTSNHRPSVQIRRDWYY